MSVRKLLLIGNGFDLAHELPTKYTDLLDWWVRRKITDLDNIQSNDSFDDRFIEITKAFKNDAHLHVFPSDRSIENYPSLFPKSKFQWKNKLLYHVFESLGTNLNWVDVEETFYKKLLEIFQDDSLYTLEYVKNLNKELNELRDLLIEYLKSDIITSKQKNMPRKFNFDDYGPDDLVVNFNYTSTFDYYYSFSSDAKKKPIVIPIHGSLKDSRYPIIFGYGDDSDQHYDEIQKRNQNEWLRSFKSFKYAQAPYYRELLSWLRTNHYYVEVIGLSLGLSDRVMFSTIFDNDHCLNIKIRDRSQEEFTDKVFNLSRHFSKPSTFRSKIEGFRSEFLIR
jgi:hypothetical protein